MWKECRMPDFHKKGAGIWNQESSLLNPVIDVGSGLPPSPPPDPVIVLSVIDAGYM